MDDVAGDPALDLAFSPNGQMVALGTAGIGKSKGKIVLLEAATGRQRARFGGALASVWSVVFSPCGRMIVSIGLDCAPLVWDVTGLIQGAGLPGEPLTTDQMVAQWDDLRHDDAAKAWTAILALAARPGQAVPFLQSRLADRKSMLEPERIAALLVDLDSDTFAVRENASTRLRYLGPQVVPRLQQFCSDKPSLEAKRRAEGIIKYLTNSGLVSEEMLLLRVLETLEYAGTADAKEVLQTEAQAEPPSSVSRAAKGALDRIAKRPSLR